MPDYGRLRPSQSFFDLSKAGDYPELLAFVLVGAALRLFRLGEESLWLDEQWMVELARERTLWETLVVVPTNNPHPPLYFLLNWLWLNGLGTSTEFVVRFPSMVFGVLSIPVFYWLAGRLFGRQVALVAGLAFTVHPVLLWYSQEGRMYALLVFLTVLSYYLLVRFVETGERSVTVSYVISGAALGYTHVFGLFALLAQALFLAWWMRYRTDSNTVTFPRFIGAYLGIGLLTLPWTGFLLTRLLSSTPASELPGGWIPVPQPADLLEVARLLSFGVTEAAIPFSRLAGPPDAFYALVLLSFALVVGGLSTGYLRDELGEMRAIVLVVFWLLIPVLVPFLASLTVRPLFQLRYVVLVIPASILLLVRGLFLVPDRWVRYGTIVILVSGLLVPLPSYYMADQKEQWRETAEFVESQAGPDDIVIVVPAWTNRSFRYYFADRNVGVRSMWSWNTVDEYRRATSNHSDVYLVLSYASTEERERTIDVISRARGHRPTDRQYFVKTVVIGWTR